MPHRHILLAALTAIAGIALAGLLGAWSIAAEPGRTAPKSEGRNGGASNAPIIVFAAASLKNALDDVAASFMASSGHDVRVSYAGSSRLARQIMAGAPADLFISANRKWMDVLETRGAIAPGSRHDILRNTLVLIAHGLAKNANTSTSAPARPSSGQIIDSAFDLAARLGDGRLAVGMTSAVPAGMYAKSALTSLGLWAGVAGQLAETDNVRAALALVARGEAPLGIVYATDAAASDDVHLIGRFPETSHPPITYPAALTTNAGKQEPAGAFLAYLTSPEAHTIFVRHGFKPLGAPEVTVQADRPGADRVITDGFIAGRSHAVAQAGR